MADTYEMRDKGEKVTFSYNAGAALPYVAAVDGKGRAAQVTLRGGSVDALDTQMIEMYGYGLDDGARAFFASQ